MAKFVILFFTVFLVAVVTSVPLGEDISPSDTAEIECKAVCNQSTDYKPLCGKDGRTYPNKSALNCKNDCAKKMENLKSILPMMESAPPTAQKQHEEYNEY